jgi:DNA-directed RNA polymerase beta' subunit
MMNPQSNSVIIGLVQDSLVGGFRMTKMDTFLTISDMFQIAMCRHYNPESENFKDMGGKDTLTPVIEEPAIIKSPKGPLYTGKQVVSFLLPDISLVKGVRTENLWNDDYVIIRNGCLLTGQLCKSTLGATNHGIIQAVFGKFGEWAACKFVSDAQRTFVTFLATHGPSISMLDCMVETPKDIIQSSLDKAAQIINLDLPYEVIEVKSSSVLQETLRNVGGTVANALETNTGLYTVVTSGSKGNLMNIAQIAGCVGQQTVFGRRVPMRASVTGKRTLAYFAPDDTTPQSRGFIARSYREGLRPEEFFYHQMAGREGIVATAVNTADSGYNQRRMIKSQESQCVAYDGTVRVCADNIVQISYGYDDMDGASVCRFRLSADVVHKAMSAAGIVKDCADFLGRVLQMRTILLKDLDTTVVCPIGADAFVDGQPPDLETLYAELIACHATLHRKPTWRMTIPAAVAIIMFWQRPGQTVPDVVRRYQCGLIQPGEGVGAIAATSIGEPSMQMTLNVFHYTGIASKNVTITGLPRFRQLINAVDSYETSNMTAEVTSFEEAPKNIGAVTLGEIADIEVDETKKHEFLTSFIGLQAGALVAKVQKKKVAVSKSPWCVVARIRWNAAEQHKLRTNEIATALRRVLGLEAIVVCPPYWAPEPFLVIIPVWVHGAVSARQWVESIAENLSNVVVSGIPGIKRSLVLQEPRWNTKLQKSSVFVIDTEGSSLVEFVKLPGIRRSSAVTNNVVEIARTIGITAGVLVLQAELHKVLSFDSSYVDPRHTWLLADTMCRAGSVCATNRHNMQSLGNSVLQRASFEQSLEVFHEGAVFGMYDPLTGSTERIMVGQPAKVGTGMVSVVTQATVEQPEATIVAPLHPKATKTSQDEELGENFVRPLRHNETFCLENHGVRVTEESKDGDNRLSDLFAHWRSHAGAFREAAQVTATQTVSANQLDAIMLECKTCGTWAQTQQNATTRVYYGSTTTIVDNAFSALHITRKVLSRHTYENVLWEVFAERKVTDLPTSIVPDRVEIVHSADFIKNGFVLQARKTFSGVTNMEAEASVAANMCVCTLQVSMASSESMLQVRATNGQFANAYANRLS